MVYRAVHQSPQYCTKQPGELQPCIFYTKNMKGVLKMARSKYKKRKIGKNEYYWHRLYHFRYKNGFKDIYGKTESELKEKIKEEEKRLEGGVVTTNKTFGKAFEEWFSKFCIVDKRPGTIDRYHGVMKNHIEKTALWNAKLMQMDSMVIQESYRDLMNDGRTADTIKTIHKLVSPFMRYLYNNGYAPRDYSKAVILPKLTVEEQLLKIKKSDVRPMTKAEQMKFIKQIQGHQFESLYLLALDTGMRQGEIFALLWRDIDFVSNQIDIYKTFAKVKDIDTGKYQGNVGPPKTQSSVRVLPLPKRTGNIVRSYKMNQAEELLKIGIRQDENTLVFCNLIGSFLDRTYVSRKLKEQFKVCGIDEEKRFHDLRHTYATRLFELGENPKVMQKLLGHSELKITLDTYTHVLESLKENSVSIIDSLYDIV